jgi:hypothetical protein
MRYLTFLRKQYSNELHVFFYIILEILEFVDYKNTFELSKKYLELVHK